MNIAFLGTGIMGRPMAERLLKAGHKLFVYNRTAEKLNPLVKLGAVAKVKASEAVEEAEYVILMLSDFAAIESVLFGERPLNLNKKTVIQMGTIAPSESRELQGRVLRAGADYCECPVLGSRNEVEEGTLILMFGGTAEQMQGVGGFLTAIGRPPVLIGPVGQAAALKLALNQLIASLGSAFALSLAFVDKTEVDREVFLKILSQSAVTAPMFEKKFPRIANHDYKDPNFPTKHMLKDVNLFMQEAKHLAVQTDSLEGVRRLLEKTMLEFRNDDYIALFETVAKKKKFEEGI